MVDDVVVEGHAAAVAVLYPQLFVGFAQARTAIDDASVLHRGGEQLSVEALPLGRLASRHGIAAQVLPAVPHVIHHVSHATVQLHHCPRTFAATYGHALDINLHFICVLVVYARQRAPRLEDTAKVGKKKCPAVVRQGIRMYSVQTRYLCVFCGIKSVMKCILERIIGWHYMPFEKTDIRIL